MVSFAPRQEKVGVGRQYVTAAEYAENDDEPLL
jgi:hypothetical protein